MREGWKYKSVGECFPFIKNGANIKQYDNAEGLPITRIETLSGGVFNRDKFGYANIFCIDKYSDYILSSRDLLMSHINSKKYIGRTVEYIANDGEQIIHGMNLLRLKSNLSIIDSTFFAYYARCNEFKKQIIKIRKDAVNQSSFAISDLKSIIIPVPPIEEQQRIVTELDLLSSIIEKQKAQLKELDTLAQSIFYDMFGDPVTNEKGWDVSELNEICDVRDGTHDSPIYYESGYPLITSKNVIDGNISFEDVNYISKEDFDNISKRSYVDDGDIIMPMIGTIGKPTIVKKEKEFAIKNVALIKFVPDSKVVNFFVRACMSFPAFENAMKRKNRGGTQKFIALGEIRKLNIILPPLSLQQQFADKIQSLESQKSAITKSIAETQKLFDYTMDKYFG